jgi:hypothetical protein
MAASFSGLRSRVTTHDRRAAEARSLLRATDNAITHRRATMEASERLR